MPTFPWLTVLGVAGLIAILSLEPPLPAPVLGDTVPGKIADDLDDYWILKRESFAQVVLAFLLMNVLIVGVPRSGWANFGSVPEWKWLLSSVLLFLFNVGAHEMGHVGTAALLARCINIVNIGPGTFSKESDEHSVKCELKKLLAFGGYMGSVPIHCRQLRVRQIAIIAAGPIASLLGGACLVAARFSRMVSETGYVLFFVGRHSCAFLLRREHHANRLFRRQHACTSDLENSGRRFAAGSFASGSQSDATLNGNCFAGCRSRYIRGLDVSNVSFRKRQPVVVFPPKSSFLLPAKSRTEILAKNFLPASLPVPTASSRSATVQCGFRGGATTSDVR